MKGGLPRGMSFWHPVCLISTGCGIGMLPWFPGTWASLAALPMAWRVERELGPGPGGRACAVVSLGGELRARLAEPEEGGPGDSEPAWAVRVGVGNQPGSLRYLRLGKRIFQTAEARFEGAEAAEIVARLKPPCQVVR